MNNITIYQIKKDIECPYMFMSYDFAKRYGFSLEDYDPIYTCERETDNLDTLYEEFNCYHPADFTGHSLSVSDIVKINSTYYYCDSFGWAKMEV